MGCPDLSFQTIDFSTIPIKVRKLQKLFMVFKTRYEGFYVKMLGSTKSADRLY